MRRGLLVPLSAVVTSLLIPVCTNRSILGHSGCLTDFTWRPVFKVHVLLKAESLLHHILFTHLLVGIWVVTPF